jgi:hypothetical protein
MKYRVSFYTLSDCHAEKEIEAADRPALMAQLDNLMIDLSAPFTIYEIYTGENKPMTTPTPAPVTSQVQQAAERFREELRADIAEIMDELKSQRAELINVRADLDAIRAGLTQAAQPAPAVGAFGEMEISAIVKTIDKNNKINYLAIGAPYAKFGVRIWDEILPAVGIDPAALEFGNNPILPTIRARVQLGETTNRTTGIKGIGPLKVTSKAA